VEVVGRVSSGRRKATADIGRHLDQLKAETGHDLIAGTLNLCLTRPVRLDPSSAIRFDKARMLWPARVADVDVWAYRWQGCKLHVLELVADRMLRSHLAVNDGDRVVVTVTPGLVTRLPALESAAWVVLWAGRESWYYSGEKYQARVRRWEKRLGLLQRA